MRFIFPNISLPVEIWNLIFGLLNLKDKCLASNTCKSWFNIIWLNILTLELSFKNKYILKKTLNYLVFYKKES